MEAKDLMIGDWVRISDDDTDEYFDAQIKGVDFLDNVYAPIPGEEKPCPFSIDCVEPIPLTPEILEKNGFEYNDEDAEYAGCTWSDGNLMLRPEYDYRIVVTNDFDDESTNRTPFVLRYVHQLQHVYKLLGIDKEITV